MSERRMETWERVEAYLDGDLDSAEVEAFERALSDPEVALELSRALALRRLLTETPVGDPPAALVARLEGVVVGEVRAMEAEAADVEAPRGLASWLMRASTQGLSAGRDGADLGWRALGLAFAPFMRTPALESGVAPSRPPLWRRLLRREPQPSPSLLRRAWGRSWSLLRRST